MENIKANRTFTVWRKYGWLLTFLIVFGGLFEHKLGLIVPFVVMLGLMITSLFDGRYWCGNVCPMQLQPYLEFDENNKLNNINCIKCKTCVNNCPKGILEIK